MVLEVPVYRSGQRLSAWSRSLGWASERLVGFESGMMIGCSQPSAIACTTGAVKVPGWGRGADQKAGFTARTVRPG